MDLVLIQKTLSLLIYPIGLISLCLVIGLLFRILQMKALSILFAILALFTFILSSNSFVASTLIASLEKQYPQLDIENTPAADFIIVLGGSLAPPAPPRQFSQYTNHSNRFWLAGQLYLAGKGKRIILSGGNVFEQKNLLSEAHYIRDKLIEMGIPKQVIIIEPFSRTTQQNALQTQSLIENTQATSAILVTSALHMPRSMQLFSELNISIFPAPSDLIISHTEQPLILKLIPNSAAINLTTRALHEYYGMCINKLKSLFR